MTPDVWAEDVLVDTAAYVVCMVRDEDWVSLKDKAEALLRDQLIQAGHLGSVTIRWSAAYRDITALEIMRVGLAEVAA